VGQENARAERLERVGVTVKRQRKAAILLLSKALIRRINFLFHYFSAGLATAPFPHLP